MSKRLFNESGQGTLEAAFVIPVLFVLMLLLIQPGIVLYDRLVMGSAAAEGCRLLATKTDAYGSMGASCEAFIRHRLAAVPQQACFHVHEGGCSWVIEMSGDETSGTATVKVINELRPLPLFDADGAAYSHKEWSAQDDADTQNAAVAAMLAEGYQQNFVTFTLGTTLAAGQTSGGGAGEHMTSFDYAYKLEAVRDWLFSQSK